jgi:hypothetical protein
MDEAPVDISSARSQLRTPKNSLVHEVDVSIVGNIVSMAEVPPEVTSTWPLYVLEYDLEVTLVDGRVVTWLKGNQPVVIDRTY